MTTLDDGQPIDPDADPGMDRGAPLRAWQGQPKAEIPDLPDPEVTACPMDTADMTRAPKMMIKRLGEGWTYSATYARGPVLVQRKEPGRDGKNHIVKKVEIVDSCALRMAHVTGVRAIAVYISGTYDMGFVWNECTDEGCVNAGFTHAMNLPVPTTATAMAVVISDDPTPGLTGPSIDGETT